MRKALWVIIGAVIATCISLSFNNYWYQDNTSYYIVRGGRIWGGTKLFSFQNPKMGWVKMDKGLSDSEAGVFIGLFKNAKDEHESMQKLMEKLDKFEKNITKSTPTNSRSDSQSTSSQVANDPHAF